MVFQVLGWVKGGQIACSALLAGLFLTAAAILGRNMAVYSKPMLAVAAAAALVGAVFSRLKAQEAELVFTDWRQSDL